MTPPKKLFRLLVLGGAVLATTPACGPEEAAETKSTGTGTSARRIGADGGVTDDDGSGPRMW